MAEISLKGTEIVVTFSDGSSYNSGVTVNRDKPDEINAKITAAIESVKGKIGLYSVTKKAELKEIKVPAVANKIRKQLGISAPAREERKKAPPLVPKGEKKVKTKAPEKKEEVLPPAPALEALPATAVPRKVVERPKIELKVLQEKIRDAVKGGGGGWVGAEYLHRNRLYIDAFLASGLKGSQGRTENQRMITAEIFNTLYRNLPYTFSVYLFSQDASSRQDFRKLAAILTDPSNKDQTLGKVGEDIIQAADTYIRYFLLKTMAHEDDYYGKEISQIGNMKTRMDGTKGIFNLKPGKGRRPSDRDRDAAIQIFLSGPIDADTMTAALLALRRGLLENPEEGKGKTPEQIELWKAPDVLPMEREAPPVAPAITKVQPPPVVAKPPSPAEVALNAFREGKIDVLKAEMDKKDNTGKKAIFLKIYAEIISKNETYVAFLKDNKIRDHMDVEKINAARKFISLPPDLFGRVDMKLLEKLMEKLKTAETEKKREAQTPLPR